MREELERLGELLGDEHDLAVLRETIVKQSVNPSLEPEAGALLPIIEKHRLRLRNQALATSAALFGTRPSDFHRRVHRSWIAWRKQKTKTGRHDFPSGRSALDNRGTEPSLHELSLS